MKIIIFILYILSMWGFLSLLALFCYADARKQILEEYKKKWSKQHDT